LWLLLISPRLALVLIIVIALLCLLGIFFQAPPSALADSQALDSWIKTNISPKIGILTYAFSFLRLYDVFHSPWFFSAGGLLMLNILCCTLNRWKNVTASFSGHFTRPGDFPTGHDSNAEITCPDTPAKTGVYAAEFFKDRRYRVRTENLDNTISMIIEKNRFSSFGTILTHFSLILLVMGFLITGIFGFRNESFIVAEGSRKEVGQGTGISLELRSFEDEYWEDGSPKDYRSVVVAYSADDQTAPTTVKVNSPLTFHGVKFFQSGFGPAERILVKQGDKTLFDEYVPLSGIIERDSVYRYGGSFVLSDNKTLVQIVSPAFSGQDQYIGEGQLAVLFYRPGMENPVTDRLELGTPLGFDDLTFTYLGDGQYSMFIVNRSPGNPLLWIACCLIILGPGITFYFPLRRFWVRIEPGKRNNSRIQVYRSGKFAPNSAEIDSLLQQMKTGFPS
jgi:cytochrome c biogenesis protein